MGDKWRVMVSRQTGKPFYHNATSGETAWERPDGLSASALGLELDAEILGLRQRRQAFRDGATLLATVQKAVASLPPHSDRLDLNRAVGTGLAAAAEAVDAVVVARADPRAAEPFNAAAEEAVAAWRTPRWRGSFGTPRRRSRPRSRSSRASSPLPRPRRLGRALRPSATARPGAVVAAAAATSLSRDRPREVSRMCRHILASAAEAGGGGGGGGAGQSAANICMLPPATLVPLPTDK